MKWLKRLFKYLFILLKVYGFLFSLLSIGYFFSKYVFRQKENIELSFEYFLVIFIEGMLLYLSFWVGSLCAINTIRWIRQEGKDDDF
jgi:hypothetical protein